MRRIGKRRTDEIPAGSPDDLSRPGVAECVSAGVRLPMFQLTTLTDYSDEALLAEVRRVAAEFKGPRLTVQEFVRLSRVHASTLRKRFGSFSRALAMAGVSGGIAPPVRHVSRDELIAAVRACTKVPGAAPTLDQIAEYLDIHRSTISKGFGPWADLVRSLGLEPVPLARRYSDAECFENIISLWTHYGRQPTIHELKVPPSKVGPKAYIGRWGGWRPALAAFIKHVNEAPAPDEPVPPPLAEDEPQTSGVQGVQALNASRTLSLALRYRVLCRDRFRCQICGRSPATSLGVELHVDHITPWSKGGPNTEENLRVLCSDCNLGKGDKQEQLPKTDSLTLPQE